MTGFSSLFVVGALISAVSMADVGEHGGDLTAAPCGTATERRISEFVKSLTGESRAKADEAAARLIRSHAQLAPAVVAELKNQPQDRQNQAMWALLGTTIDLDDDRERAHRTFQALEPFIPLLLSQTQPNEHREKRKTDAISRGNATVWLGRLYGHVKPPESSLEQIVPVFRKLLKDESAYVRGKVFTSLLETVYLGDARLAESLLPDLIALIESDSDDPGLRVRACAVLGAIGPDAAAGAHVLLGMLDDRRLGWMAECALYRVSPDLLEKSGKAKVPLRAKKRLDYLLGVRWAPEKDMWPRGQREEKGARDPRLEDNDKRPKKNREKTPQAE